MTTFRSSKYAHARRGRRRGVEIVEFALIIPIVLAILMAVVEFGWMIKNQLTLANSARDGARYAALGNTSTATLTRIKNGASTLMPALTDAQITLEQSADKLSANPTFTAWPTDSTSKNGVPVGNIIRIRISYTNQSLTGYFPFMRNRSLNVAVTMLREAN